MADTSIPVTVTVTPPPGPKPGWKTSEFWLKIAALFLSALFASDVIPTGSALGKVVAIAATMLGALGYTVSRTIVKTAAMFALIAFGLRTTTGCSWTRNEAQVVKTAAVDCTKGELSKAVTMFAPTVGKLLELATGGDGKLDWNQVEDGTKKLAGDVGGCVLSTAVARALKPAPAGSGAPKSSPLAIDPTDLRAHFEATRAARFGGKSYLTEAGPL